MPSLLLRGIAAAAMCGVTAIHCGATPALLDPIEHTSLSTAEKGIHWLCWHGVSVFMLATDILYLWPFIRAPQPDNLAVLLFSGSWIVLAAAALYKSIKLGKPGLYALQYVGLSLIPLLAILSLDLSSM